MKNRKTFGILLCLFSSALVITGCKEESVEENEEENLTAVDINSLYDGMVALYQTKNYTFEIVHTYGGRSYREDLPDMIFTKKYVGYDGKMFEDMSLYYNDDNGIYHVSFADDYQAGEYLKDKSGNNYKNLWDNSVVSTLYGVGGAYIKKNVTKETNEIVITDKDYTIKFLETITGTAYDYSIIDAGTFVAKYENNKVSFDLSLNHNDEAYKVTLKNVGTTTSSHLKMFIGNGGQAFVPEKNLTEMRRLLNLDNYIQMNYLINEGEYGWSGYQIFTDHYYMQTGTDISVGNAYMEFDYDDDPTLDNDYDLHGIYLVNVFRTEEGSIDASLVGGRAYNSDTMEVEECVRYPSLKLDLLKNLEYVKKGEVRNANYEGTADLFKNGSEKYYFIDEKLVRNFCNNFGLDTYFEDVAFNTIAIETSIAADDKDSIICFHAIGYYPGDGMTYDYLIPLIAFGNANRAALDTLYEMYNKK